jgi:hypothetical protein
LTPRVVEFDELDLTGLVPVHHLAQYRVVSGFLAAEKGRKIGGEGVAASDHPTKDAVEEALVAFGAPTCAIVYQIEPTDGLTGRGLHLLGGACGHTGYLHRSTVAGILHNVPEVITEPNMFCPAAWAATCPAISLANVAASATKTTGRFIRATSFSLSSPGGTVSVIHAAGDEFSID